MSSHGDSELIGAPRSVRPRTSIPTIFCIHVVLGRCRDDHVVGPEREALPSGAVRHEASVPSHPRTVASVARRRASTSGKFLHANQPRA
jgi:hypothetical protein